MNDDQSVPLPNPSTPMHLMPVLRNILKRCDKNWGIKSSQTFEDLQIDADITERLRTMNLHGPSKIQTLIPSMMNNPDKDIIIQAASGSGKTLAFGIAVLNRIDPIENHPQVLVVSPTTEVAMDTISVFSQICVRDITIGCALNGVGTWGHSGLTQDYETGQVIISSPKSICSERAFVMLDLSKIRLVIFDDADLIVTTSAMKLMVSKLPENCKKMLVSTTLNRECVRFLEKPLTISDSDPLISPSIEQYVMFCDSKKHKDNVVKYVVKQAINASKNVLIFCNKRQNVDNLCSTLNDNGITSLPVYSEHIDRMVNVQKFVEGRNFVLVTTNLLARGVNLKPKIVINYEMPANHIGEPDFKSYIHRVGRSGRFGKSGMSLTLVNIDPMIILQGIHEKSMSQPKEITF